MHSISQTKATEILHLGTWIKQPRKGKNFVLVPTLLCIHLLWTTVTTKDGPWGPLAYFFGSICFFYVFMKMSILRSKYEVLFFSLCLSNKHVFVPLSFKTERKSMVSKHYFSFFLQSTLSLFLLLFIEIIIIIIIFHLLRIYSLT